MTVNAGLDTGKRVLLSWTLVWALAVAGSTRAPAAEECLAFDHEHDVIVDSNEVTSPDAATIDLELERAKWAQVELTFESPIGGPPDVLYLRGFVGGSVSAFRDAVAKMAPLAPSLVLFGCSRREHFDCAPEDLDGRWVISGQMRLQGTMTIDRSAVVMTYQYTEEGRTQPTFVVSAGCDECGR